ncbi:hypothetical protein K438DRAFT_1765773 [Mycena galopus ATCC 62051]|nr:hypothetical protein K438DRAFT_1765773 [Mycena galopus ATCC 62051]
MVNDQGASVHEGEMHGEQYRGRTRTTDTAPGVEAKEDNWRICREKILERRKETLNLQAGRRKCSPPESAQSAYNGDPGARRERSGGQITKSLYSASATVCAATATQPFAQPRRSSSVVGQGRIEVARA